VVAALANNVANSFNATLIVLFEIFFGLSALSVGSFYMVFFISFANLM